MCRKEKERERKKRTIKQKIFHYIHTRSMIDTEEYLVLNRLLI